MLQVSVRIKDDGLLEKMRRDFTHGALNILNRIKQDVHRLGEDCYKYSIKRNIPVSKLSRPHIRDSFRVVTQIIQGPAIYLLITSDLDRAFYADIDATIPTRFPRAGKAMRWLTSTGEVVFAKKAKGFRKPGLHFTYWAEIWLTENVFNYIDESLNKYL